MTVNKYGGGKRRRVKEARVRNAFADGLQRMHQVESFQIDETMPEQVPEAAPGRTRSLVRSTRERIAEVDKLRLGSWALFGAMSGVLVTGGVVHYLQTRPYDGPEAYPKDFTYLKEHKGESFKGVFLDYGREQGWTTQQSRDALAKLMNVTLPRFADTRAELRAGLRDGTAYGITIVDMDEKVKTDQVIAIETDALTGYAAPPTSTPAIPR
jgi:hypothetical protein